MKNPLKVIKDFYNTKVSKDELKQSQDFINWALKNGYNLFDLAFDKCKMSNAIEMYKISIIDVENNVKENDYNEI